MRARSCAFNTRYTPCRQIASHALFTADESAFGSREDKLSGCKLQRLAWDKNAKLLTPLFTAVREPLPRERRLRGEVGATFAKQQSATVRRRDEFRSADAEVEAKRALEAAASSRVSAASHAVLSPSREGIVS